MPYYGTNGFYLPFSDNSTTTALGYDLSGDATSRYNATVAGNAQISTAQSKFGGSSAYFDGTGDYLTLNGSSDFAFGTGDFTIEFWVRFNTLDSVNQNIYESRPSGTGTGAYAVIQYIYTTQKIQYMVGNVVAINSTTTPVINTWYHVAVCRSGTSTKLFINGTQEGSTYTDSTNYLVGASRPAIGTYDGAVSFLKGYIDDLRVYKGYAKYTANFTAPTTALPIGSADPNWRYCSLAMPMDGTNASTTFPIYAPNSWTPTNFSVTAGSGNDSLIDTPTPYADGSTNRGNYCTLNPLSTFTTATLANGNLDFTTTTVGHNAIATFGMYSGKWYWEAQTSAGTTEARATVCNSAGTASSYYSFAANATAYGFRFDADAGTLDYTTNGTTWTSLATGLTSGPYFPFFNNNGTTSKTISVNFGQRAFSYTPPAGFKALNTYNLP